jgi:hypothetical protein
MNNIYENIKDICLSHQLINDYGSGDIFRLNDLKDVKYPIIWTELNQTDLNYTQINPSLKIFYIDRVKDDQTDASEIEIDAGYVLNDIINSISSFYQILSISTVTPFNHKFFDMTAGGYIDIQLSDCSDGVGVVQSIEASYPNLLPSEYVEYSGMTLKSALDQLNINCFVCLSGELSLESSIRSSIDLSLESSISTEISIRSSVDLSLESSISTESSIREYNDEQILIVIPMEYSALTYNIQYSDKNKCLLYNNSISGTTIIPSDSTVDFPIGTVISFCQKGNGQIVISGEGGVTIQGSYKSASINKFLQIWKVESNNWYVIGGTD